MKSLPSIQENRIGFHHAVRRKERGNPETGIRFENLKIEATDMPFVNGSGAGVIFGVTGGVTEAVLRRLREGHTVWKWRRSNSAVSAEKRESKKSRIARSKGIYDTDINTQIKKSNENPLVQSLYDGLFYFIISTIA